MERLLKGVEVGPGDVGLLNGDSIGHTIKGKEASYSQRILFQDIVIRSPRLTELSIHSEDCHSHLTREPTHDWLELCEQSE